jgi:hypothetical protein
VLGRRDEDGKGDFIEGRGLAGGIVERVEMLGVAAGLE